jgi:hypothetical protein
MSDAVQPEDAASDIRAAERLHPQVMADDDEAIAAGTVLVLGERAAPCHRCAKEAEVRGSNEGRPKLVRGCPAGLVHHSVPEGRHVVNNGRLRSPVLVHDGRGARSRPAGDWVSERDNPFRVGKRRRPEKDRIRNREHGHIRPDPGR